MKSYLNNKVNNWIKVVLSITLVFLLYIVVLEVKQYPEFKYNLKSYETTQGVQEEPMTIVTQKVKRGFDFKVVFTDDRENSEKVKLMLQSKFERVMPYLTYGNDIKIQMINEDRLTKEGKVIYELSGSVNKLKPGQYKISVIDPNNNLVDERVVVID